MGNELSVAEKRLACVAEQIHAMQHGKAVVIGCPYCGKVNIKHEPICCELCAKAIRACLDAQDLGKRLEFADKIANRVN